MKYQFIDWDSIPDVINKDQFYQICHISKSTALHLLKSGKVPCDWTGKKSRCYMIKKEDVKEYLQTRAVYPELYSAPSGWYGNHYVAKLSKELPEEVLGCMHAYYSKILKDYNDVLTVKEVMDLTGYAKTTIIRIDHPESSVRFPKELDLNNYLYGPHNHLHSQSFWTFRHLQNLTFANKVSTCIFCWSLAGFQKQNHF